MDEKDPKDEELNQQEQDNVNEADDSFGLPDLDYKPLEEETSEADEEIESDEVSETEDQPSYESDSSTYSSDTDEEEEKPTLRYQMEEESSNAPKIIGGIIGVLALAAIIWYVGFYRPKQQKLADEAQAKQEELDYKKAQEAETLKKQAAADAAAAADNQTPEVVPEDLNAEVKILSERSGRYYIVLESFIDEDFAKDFGNKIAKEGTPSFLIPPYSKKKMQRVAIGGYESMDEAQTGLNNLSEEFGTGKWILKY